MGDRDGDSDEKKTVESDMTPEETTEFKKSFEENKTTADMEMDTKSATSNDYNIVHPRRAFFDDVDFFGHRHPFDDDFFGAHRNFFSRNTRYTSHALEDENRQLRERVSKLEEELQTKRANENTSQNQTEKN